MFFSDAHLHSNPVKGLGAGRISAKFRKEGGWFIALVALPPHYYGIEEINIESYRRVLDILNREAKAAVENGVKVVRLMGFHPAEVDEYYKQGIKGRRLYELAEKVLNLIEDALKNGLLDGIGEVGRQHYGTSVERIVVSEAIMIRALEIARNYDAVVHLHLEQGGWVTAYSIKKLRDLIGFKHSKIILHHSAIDTAVSAEELGLGYTIPIKSFNKEAVSLKLSNAMIESDFIDDPGRPGVASYPWEIPRVIRNYLEDNLVDDEYVYRVMVDNVSRYYGVSP